MRTEADMNLPSFSEALLYEFVTCCPFMRTHRRPDSFRRNMCSILKGYICLIETIDVYLRFLHVLHSFFLPSLSSIESTPLPVPSTFCAPSALPSPAFAPYIFYSCHHQTHPVFRDNAPTCLFQNNNEWFNKACYSFISSYFFDIHSCFPPSFAAGHILH